MTARHQAIAPIAAFTATEDQDRLRDALTAGLEAGLTVAEIKEVLVQLYAYAGFPRSLNALGTFMTVLDHRRTADIDDPPGTDPTPLPDGTHMLELGAANQTELTGRPVTGPLFAFAPAIDRFLKAHLLGDIFARDNLDWPSREIATIAALATLTGTESQLQSHLTIGLNTGLTKPQLRELVQVIRTEIGQQQGETADRILDQVLTNRQETP
jgi:4-carboxymuconolactone decarboxylase